MTIVKEPFNIFIFKKPTHMKNLLLLIVLSMHLWTHAQPASFKPKGLGGGGALFFPKINPGNDNEFHIACDMSEMFHSTDFGNSYSQIHFSKLTSLNIFNVSATEYTVTYYFVLYAHLPQRQALMASRLVPRLF